MRLDLAATEESLDRFPGHRIGGDRTFLTVDALDRKGVGFADRNLIVPGHFGNMARDTLISPGLADMDFSLQKNFKVTENQRIQFRWEVFNLLNRANFAEPATSPYTSSSAPNTNFWNPTPTIGGQITATDLRPRTMQLGLKYTF